MYRVFVKLTFLIPAIVISQGKLLRGNNMKRRLSSSCSRRLRDASGKLLGTFFCFFLESVDMSVFWLRRCEPQKTLTRAPPPPTPTDPAAGLFRELVSVVGRVRSRCSSGSSSAGRFCESCLVFRLSRLSRMLIGNAAV